MGWVTPGPSTYVPVPIRKVRHRVLGYDANGRVASQSTPEGQISYTYTADGTLESIATGSQKTSYHYNAFGQVVAIESTVFGTATQQVRYLYSSATGRKTEVQYPNGAKATYTYTARGWVDTITHKAKNGQTLLALDYERDKRGLILEIGETHPESPTTTRWFYRYDSLKRLVRAEHRDTVADTQLALYEYAYDTAGNRTWQKITDNLGVREFTYTHGTLDQLLTETQGTNVKSFAYDRYGNQVAETLGTGEAATTQRTYTWNAKNQLTSAWLRIEGEPEGKNIEYSYDEHGSRVRRMLHVPNEPDETTLYLTDTANPTGYSQVLEERTPDGATQQSFTWGGEGLLAQQGSSGTSYAHGDHLGTVRRLTGGTGTAIPGSGFAYEPFGTLASGDSTLSPYKFTGQFADGELGMQYHRARCLNTTHGNWLSQDCMLDPRNFFNLYAYVGQSPASHLDPSGMLTLAGASVAAGLSSGLSALASMSILALITLGAQIGTYYLANEILNRQTLLIQVRDENLLKLADYNTPRGALTVTGTDRRTYWLPVNPADYRFYLGIFAHIIPRLIYIPSGYGYRDAARGFVKDMGKEFGKDIPSELEEPSYRAIFLVTTTKSSPSAPFFGGGIRVSRNTRAGFLIDSSVYSEDQVLRSNYKNLGSLGIGELMYKLSEFVRGLGK